MTIGGASPVSPQGCVIFNGSGTISHGPVTDLLVTCGYPVTIRSAPNPNDTGIAPNITYDLVLSGGGLSVVLPTTSDANGEVLIYLPVGSYSMDWPPQQNPCGAPVPWDCTASFAVSPSATVANLVVVCGGG